MRSQTFWRLSVALLGLTYHGVTAVGYYIDTDSCNANQITAVNDAMQKAIALAAAGVANVDAADANPNGPQQKLIDNLFGPDPAVTEDGQDIKTIIRSTSVRPY
ncbi:hypothetical protein F4805DRAFT_433120 [Annulohypoxylon moriforme]|nr:hypothetical protein F4805DRAFT_433120 [Annulohypoxylon moriforme]